MPPPPDQPIALATWLLIFVIPLVISILIFFLREHRPTEVYVVWYAFALFFVVFSFLSAYAWKNHKNVKDVFGQFAWGEWVYHWLTDWNAEVWMVLIFLGLVVLPQWLAYFLSGLSGSASPPMLVLQATDVAMWSLIKTVASLSGIALAGFLWAQEKFDLTRLIEAEMLLLGSFGLLVYRYVVFKGAADKLRRWFRRRAFFFYAGPLLYSLVPVSTISMFPFSIPRPTCLPKERWYVLTLLRMQYRMRRLRSYFTKYRETTSTTPTIVDKATSSASDALTMITVQVLRDPRVKSAIVDQASSSAVEVLTQALRDPRVKSAIVDQARSSAVEVLTEALRDPKVTSAISEASSRVVEALTTGTEQARPDSRVTCPSEGVEPRKT